MAIRRSIRVLLPAPGGPVMPIVQARNGRGPRRRITTSASRPLRSTRLIARARARGESRTSGSDGLEGMEREDTTSGAGEFEADELEAGPSYSSAGLLDC